MFLWIDLEMTGLDATTDRILEVAVVVTDSNYMERETWDTAVYQPPAVLEAMSAWCVEHHGASGLTERVPQGLPEKEVDARLAATIHNHWGEEPAVLCGNSIHQDRKFIDLWLPLTAGRLHYRMLDVSAFKVLFRERYNVVFEKRNTHRALDDIRESIAELRHYEKFIRVPTGEGG